MAGMENSLQPVLQEQILTKNRQYIIENLEPDDILDKLIQERIIGTSGAQRIQLSGTSRIDKNRIICDQLATAGPDGFNKFCEILRENIRQTFIAERLEKYHQSLSKNVYSLGLHSVATTLSQCTVDVTVISRLKSRYCKHLSTDDTDWPHSYIRLALVKQEEKITRVSPGLKEITKMTLQGQVDEILLKKEVLGGLKDIFHYKNTNCPRLILVMGAPGE